jgi:hypothetical protein
LNLDEDSDGLRREGIGVEQIQFGGVGNWSQFRNKITFYPVVEGAYVYTKIWNRKESDLWVQPGEKIRLGEGMFLQKDSAKEPAVGNLLPFGKETVCADFVTLRDDVARAEEVNGWISDHI